MDWIALIGAVFGGSVLSAVGSILYFKPKLREAQAKAKTAETEAADKEHASLAARVESLTKLYTQQGESLDALRKQLLEMAEQKQQSDLRVIQVETENKQLRERVSSLEQEVTAYKTIVKKP